MLALKTQRTDYPVLFPVRAGHAGIAGSELWGPEGREATRRRRRRYPVLSALTVAAFVVLPFILYVAAVSNAAHIGYRILKLNQDIAGLQTDHERLQAIASSLRAPDRIERLAAERLGLRTPGPGQTAALELPSTSVRARMTAGPGLWQRLGAYFHGSEAQAAPPPP
jgi:cell division protein FtsL